MSSISFSSRWISRVRSRMMVVRASQVAQLTNWFWRHERTSHQTVHAEPGRVRDVTLSPGQVLHVPGVHQHDLEGSLFEQAVEGLPVLC